MRKFLSIIIILSVLVFQIDYNKKPVQAALPLAVYGIAYVASAMVAAGATGYVQKSVDGEFYGTLWDAAKNAYDLMEYNLQNTLMASLAVSSYLAMSQVPGLWDYLHNQFIQSDIVPKESAYFDAINSQLPVSTIFTTRLADGLTESDINSINAYGLQGTVTYYNNGEYWTGDSGITFKVGHVYEVVPYMSALGIYNHTENITVVQRNTLAQTLIVSFTTGKLVPQTISLGNTITGINDEKPINPPADPTQLNQATPLTTYLDRNGVMTTPIPGVDTIAETGSIDAQRSAAAAAAAAAAIAAALAAGYTQGAADAAGAAAAAAIYAGQTAAEAAAAGAAAASAFVGAATGTITGILQNIWTSVRELVTADAVPITDIVAPITGGVMTPLPTQYLTQTMQRLQNMNTDKGTAPKIKVPLNQMANTMTPITHISNPFAQDEYVFIDFAIFDTLQFLGLSLIDYFRGVIGFGLIIRTFMFTYRKIYPEKVLA